mgnify:CR=1 FL=1
MAKPSSSERPGRKALWKIRLRSPRRVKQIALLPTVPTLIDGICGFYAMIHIAQVLVGSGGADAANHLHTAAYLILIAMIFDALDGRVAGRVAMSTEFQLFVIKVRFCG